ncbi:MAG: hypothetical protein DLM59_12595 [Pseudonocardiales bacterium]|nr:MAG: hypothetical protein DLM59_12595 [Pseudonocardiales bacterium]
MVAVDRIHALAERSPGFIWRLQSSAGHLNGAEILGDPLAVVNVSVWASYPLLHEYVYRSRHGSFVRRRDRWFGRLPSPTAGWRTTVGPTALRPTCTGRAARSGWGRSVSSRSGAHADRRGCAELARRAALDQGHGQLDRRAVVGATGPDTAGGPGR